MDFYINVCFSHFQESHFGSRRQGRVVCVCGRSCKVLQLKATYCFIIMLQEAIMVWSLLKRRKLPKVCKDTTSKWVQKEADTYPFTTVVIFRPCAPEASVTVVPVWMKLRHLSYVWETVKLQAVCPQLPWRILTHFREHFFHTGVFCKTYIFFSL